MMVYWLRCLSEKKHTLLLNGYLFCPYSMNPTSFPINDVGVKFPPRKPSSILDTRVIDAARWSTPMDIMPQS